MESGSIVPDLTRSKQILRAQALVGRRSRNGASFGECALTVSEQGGLTSHLVLPATTMSNEGQPQFQRVGPSLCPLNQY
jgi:hypothetical protein